MSWSSLFTIGVSVALAVSSTQNICTFESQLLEAVTRNDATAVSKLLYQNPSFDPNFNDGQALNQACSHGQLDIVKRLLAHPQVHPGVADNKAILSAAINLKWNVVALLMTRPLQVDPSVQNSFVFRHACSNGQYDIAELLLVDKRVDPSADDCSALLTASEYGHANIVRLLLRLPGIDPTISEGSPLYFALLGPHPEVANELILDRRIVALMETNVPKYTKMVISTLETLFNDGNLLAVNILVKRLFKEQLPTQPLVEMLRRNLSNADQIALRILMEPVVFSALKPEASYEEFIKNCAANNTCGHILLISGLAPASLVPMLISQAINNARADIIAELLLDGADLINWAWKLSTMDAFRRLSYILNLQFIDRWTEICINEHGSLFMILALHSVEGSHSGIVRYIPFLNTPNPFELLSRISYDK